MGSDETRCFDLLQAFARALNHELRTPLAVVSNDLHFFAGNDPSGVGAGSLAQCRRMSAVLRRAAALGAEPLAARPLTMTAWADALGITPPPLELTVCADPNRLKLLGALIEQLTAQPRGAATTTPTETSLAVRFESATAIAPDSLERVLADTIVTAFGGTFSTIDVPPAIIIELPRYHP